MIRADHCNNTFRQFPQGKFKVMGIYYDNKSGTWIKRMTRCFLSFGLLRSVTERQRKKTFSYAHNRSSINIEAVTDSTVPSACPSIAHCLPTGRSASSRQYMQISHFLLDSRTVCSPLGPGAASTNTQQPQQRQPTGGAQCWQSLRVAAQMDIESLSFVLRVSFLRRWAFRAKATVRPSRRS